MTATQAPVTAEDAELAALDLGISRSQFRYLTDLTRDRAALTLGETAQERLDEVYRSIIGGVINRGSVSMWIDRLRNYPAALGSRTVRADGNTQSVNHGVYEFEDAVYVVKSNKAKTAFYAMRVVELAGSAQRLTLEGEHVKFELRYAPGIVNQLLPEHQMTKARASELMTRYGKCINCRRPLRAAKSVEQGYGPVCIKAFR